MTKAKKKSPYIVTPGFTFKREDYAYHIITNETETTKHRIAPSTSITTYGVKAVLTAGQYLFTNKMETYEEAEELYNLINKQL